MPVNVSVVVSHDGVQRHTQLFVGYRPGAPLGTLQWRDEEDIRSFFVQCDNIRAELARDGFLGAPVADDVPPMMSMSHAAPQGPWPDEATVAVSELTVRIAKLDHMTKKLLDALEAAAREPSVETDERVCAAIGALRGRPADNPHDWGAWSPVASLALGGRSVQMRQCIYCRTVVMSEQPSLTDCDPGDEQP
ncbi:MAG TPA: hypothetical protein PK478_02920 [Nitrospira sp.]|nr:hypothetical protein [Nitrospira sp.]